MGTLILVLVREADLRALACASLRQAGFRCAAGASVDDGLVDLAGAEPQVVVVGLDLPGGSVAVVQRVRTMYPAAAVVAIGRRAEGNVAGEVAGRSGTEWLPQLFTRGELTGAVGRALDGQRAGRDESRRREQLQAEIDGRRDALVAAFARLGSSTLDALEDLLRGRTRLSDGARGHARRVARLAGLLANGLGLPAASIPDVERGALLHDVGKAVLPEAVVSKEVPLTPAELALLRTHPQLGHDVVLSGAGLGRAAEIVLAAHEWYDGTGYPRGLVRDAIPPGARITAVVDTFDLLTSACEYQDPWPPDLAAAELVRGAGRRFDPDIVRVWLRLLDRYVVAGEPWPQAIGPATEPGARLAV